MKEVNKVLFIVLLTSMFFVSCKTKQTLICENAVPAKLINKQIDGCSWLIQLENGQILEPINLKEFDIERKNNKKIWVTYENTEGYVSICMMGPIIRITCLSER